MLLRALHFSNPSIHHRRYTSSPTTTAHPRLFPYDIRLPIQRFSSITVQSHYNQTTTAVAESESPEPSISSEYIDTVGLPPNSVLQLSQWNLTHRHVLVLNVIACAAAVSATWLFLSAIPTLLAFKRAAESLENDLTMELSDLGQEITQGVKSSTRAVRVAEERLRQLTNITPTASLQRVGSLKNDTGGPELARTARGMREGIVKGRSILQIFFTIIQFSRMAFNYFAKRNKK
ncbi:TRANSMEMBRANE PROTEIN [Salix viminalis]|uniref:TRANSMEMBRANE PROTEIN n=1 Tax=Salix viminalis TaxID=40686 RepID=A0A9Q0NY40_SALVM|nr:TRANSMEMBRANE PROTEIN [Salix viminalis]